MTDTSRTFCLSQPGILPMDATVRVSVKGGRLFFSRTANPLPERRNVCAEPGRARGADDRCHVGAYAIKESQPHLTEPTEMARKKKDDDSSPIPSPPLGRGIPHVGRTSKERTGGGETGQRRQVGVQSGGSKGTDEVPMLLDASPPFPAYLVDSASSSDRGSRGEVSSSSDSSCDDATVPDDNNLPPTIQTAMRQIGAHVTGPHDSDEIREGKTLAYFVYL